MSQKSLDKLIASFNISEPIHSEDELIKINQVIGAAALIYEKVRNAMDYREDHLLRKNAIYRILKRKFLIEKLLLNQPEEKVAEQIVYEMIRAGYLKNNQIPKTKINEVLKITQKYHLLSQHGDLTQSQYLWVLELQACEIEDALCPNHIDQALVKFAFQIMHPRVLTNRGEIEDKEKELQLLISLDRALRKSDNAMLSYKLWNLYYPHWINASNDEVIKIALNTGKIKQEIEEQLNHPWRKSLNKIIRKHAIVFWTLKDIIAKDPTAASEIFFDETSLELSINKATEARYKDVSKKLRRGVVRSIIYVFFTKMLLALILELPLDLYFKGVIDYATLGINILFPPILMFFVAITIRTPGKKNTQKIIFELKDIIFDKGKAQTFKLKAPRKRSFFTSLILDTLYLLVFAVSVYYIFRGLELLEFMWFSALIFIFFLSVVSFFGIRIRRPIQEITIEEKRDNIFTLLIDFLSLPFATVGQWLSFKFSKINIFAFVFDFIIEAPFKIFIEILEDLFSFWREKKEEAYEQE